MSRKRSAYRPKYSNPAWIASRKLGTQPWRISTSLEPIEKIIDEMERTGLSDTVQGQVVFRDTGSKHYYSAVPALQGVVEFYELATKRHGWPLDVTALTRLGKKLEVACPVVQADIDAARKALAEIRKYAPSLTLGEADDLVNTVRISQEMERLGVAAK